mgnify:CR=1 FL=1
MHAKIKKEIINTFKTQILVDDEDLSEDVKKLGFPKNHPHRLACLRQELIDAFVE